MQKYFPDVEETVMFLWGDDGTKERRIIKHTSCMVNNEQVAVGDNVCVHQDLDLFAVGRLIDLFENAGCDPHRAVIRWYYIYDELPKKIKTMLKSEKYFAHHKRELFLVAEDFRISPVEEIDAETIARRCTIHYLQINPELTKLGRSEYFIRYEFGLDLAPLLPDSKPTTQEKTPKHKKLKEKMKVASEPLKRIHPPPCPHPPPRPQLLITNSPKRRGSDSVYEHQPPDKMTKIVPKKQPQRRKTLSTADVLAEINRSDDDGDDDRSEITASDASSVYSKSDASSVYSVQYNQSLTKRKQKKTSFVRLLECSPVKVTLKNVLAEKKKVMKREASIESDNDDEDDDEDDDASCNEESSSEDDSNEVSVRKRRRKTICMPSQTSGKKRKPVMRRTMTPSISKRSFPRLQPKSPLEHAKQKLHVSAVPDCLPCREKEFDAILSYVADRLQEHTGGCMYISGVPGTGKTATVYEVIRTLQTDYSDIVPQFRFIELNGMKLTDPNQAYCSLLKKLTGQKLTCDHAASLLEKRFSNPTPKKEHVVVLVDELDLLWTRKQNVMYNLFDWPTRRHSRLVILAVANTMDLPERIMMNRVSSRLGLTRMTFQPYNFKQLQEIVLSRISGIEAFEEHALQLVARKVAAVSGDARRCLDICRRAVEIADSASSQGIVGMKQVDSALKEMFSSPKVLALRSLSLMETLFMKAVISEFRRTGFEEAVFFEVYDQFRSHCQFEGYQPLNTSETFTVCTSLAACRLLIVENGQKDIYQRIRLNVNTDDVLFAFKSNSK